MKRKAFKILLSSSLFTLLLTTSCSVLEEYTSVIFKKETEDIVVEDTLSYEDVTMDYESDVILEEDAEFTGDVLDSIYYAYDYEEEFADVEIVDTLAHYDSLEVVLQERINRENSGEAIVEESDVMMNMIDNLADIPYFEQNKLESSSKSENIYKNAPAPTVAINRNRGAKGFKEMKSPADSRFLRRYTSPARNRQRIPTAAQMPTYRQSAPSRPLNSKRCSTTS